MKQTIRLETFETNSSSYHTLSIYKNSSIPKPREIIKGEDLVINTKIPKKTIGYTESYSFIGITTYNKAQMVLRFMGYKLENQLDNLVDEKEYLNEHGYWDHEKRNVCFEKVFYKAPLIQAFVKAIKKFIGEDKNVTIEFTCSSSPFIDQVSDEAESVADLFRVNEDDLTNVNLMADKFYEIIFNDDFVMEEVCESNE